jgi:hypothetical protein
MTVVSGNTTTLYLSNASYTRFCHPAAGKREDGPINRTTHAHFLPLSLSLDHGFFA